VLLLGIIQIGPTIVLIPVLTWYWLTKETAPAVLFTIYLIPVSLMDNVLRPLVMAHGLNTPMPVIFIGLIGGTIAHGLIGLFVGPVVLAIMWQLLVAWTREKEDEALPLV
jgi:predicted PurR-regulated permease PerM